MTRWDGTTERRKKDRRHDVCLLHADLKAMVDELRKVIVGRWAFNIIMGFVVAAFLFVGYGMREMNREINSIAVSQAKMASSIDTILKLYNAKME